MFKSFLKKSWPIIVLIFLDAIFFAPLFLPNQKLIVTPEFGGGDTITIQLPYKYKLCEKVKQFALPFWSKDMAAGYPLLAEGEIGAFNPVNLATCFFFDYKTAFNLQIALHTFIGQVGLLILSAELGLTVFAGLFLSVLFPFTPLLLMNYMQITLVYPLFYLPYLLYSLLKLIKDGSFRSFLLLSFFVFLQFTVSHYQTFFISFIFLAGFLLSYLHIDRKRKKKIRLLFFFFLAYIVGVLLAGFQLVPSIEFFMNSNRSSEIYGSFASTYDQNLGIKNFLTLFSPYLFGKPQNGTLSDGMALPWEGTFFIYYCPLFFLILFFLYSKNHYGKEVKSLILSFFFILLIALGKNSPIYFIHSFPIFSSFRYPSRFVFILVFILTVFSAYGLDFLVRRIPTDLYRKFFVFLVLGVVLFESYSFNYDFHVLLDAKKVFSPNKLSEFFKKEGNPRIYSPLADLIHINNFFYKNGYKGKAKDPLFLYHRLTDTLFPQVNIIYGIGNNVSYIGAQLKRNPISYNQIFNGKNLFNNDKSLRFEPSAENILKISGIKYIVSKYLMKEEFLILNQKTKTKSGNEDTYLYEVVDSLPRVQFYTLTQLIQTYQSYVSAVSSKQKNFPLLIEDQEIVSISSRWRNNTNFFSKYVLLSDKDEVLKIATETNSESVLVVADNFYPGWKAFVDGHETPIFRANFNFRGIRLPSGKHTVEFRYAPDSAIWGGYISGLTVLTLVFYGFLRRRKTL